jgi:hypothetical protein
VMYRIPNFKSSKKAKASILFVYFYNSRCKSLDTLIITIDYHVGISKYRGVPVNIIMLSTILFRFFNVSIFHSRNLYMISSLVPIFDVNLLFLLTNTAS